jgi:hypothetical protein
MAYLPLASSDSAPNSSPRRWNLWSDFEAQREFNIVGIKNRGIPKVLSRGGAAREERTRGEVVLVHWERVRKSGKHEVEVGLR